MTLNRALALTSVALGAVLATQVAFLNSPTSQPLERRYYASWVDHANTLKEGLEKSDHVILGEVVELMKGPDLVVPAVGEPSGEDRIPTTIVKLRVSKTYKSAATLGKFVELMQTGQSTDAELLPRDPFPEDDNDRGPFVKGKRQIEGESKKSPTGPSAGDPRATVLEDDPAYLVGEKYVLFLKDMQHSDGSAAALAGVNPKMKRVLAPEGRMQITKSDRLKPATTRRGFAPDFVGKPLTELENELAQAR